MKTAEEILKETRDEMRPGVIGWGTDVVIAAMIRYAEEYYDFKTGPMHCSNGLTAAKYFEANIKWQDGEVCEGYIFKMGDIVEGEDDGIFFYIEQESNMDALMVEGVEDFVVLSYQETSGAESIK